MDDEVGEVGSIIFKFMYARSYTQTLTLTHTHNLHKKIGQCHQILPSSLWELLGHRLDLFSTRGCKMLLF